MKNILLIGLLLQIISSSAQDNSLISQDYIEFLKYFENKKIGEINENTEDIPVSLFQCVIGFQCVYGAENDETVTAIEPMQILNNERNTTVVYKIFRAEDRNTSDFHLMTFSPIGIPMKSKVIGVNGLTSVIKETCEIHYYNDHLLDVIQLVKINKDNKEVVRKIEHIYYVIDKKGFNQFFPEYTLGRKFPISSTIILKDTDLEVYTSDQLELMKNEILAEYGYIFNNDNWMAYFKKEKWYEPKNSNVDSLLTEIESINLQNILKKIEVKE